MSKVRSSLNRTSLDSRLPVIRDKFGNATNIQHRPQESPSCVLAYGGNCNARGGRKVKLPEQRTSVYAEVDGKFIKREVVISEYKREYDNPEINDTCIDENGKLHWSRRDYSNLNIAMKYVAILNNPKNREAWALPLARRDYLKSLEQANICGLCKKPVKTVKAKVSYIEALDIPRDTLIAKVKAHYEVFLDSQTGKYIFRYIDGLGRKLVSKKTKFGSEYFDNAGNKTYAAGEYNVIGTHCTC